MSDVEGPRRVVSATIDDVAGISAVLAAAFEEYAPLYTPAAFAATTPAAAQIRDRWHEGPVWIAVGDGAILGTIAAVPKSRSLYIRSMAVLPAAGGQGLGRLLLTHAEGFASRHGYSRMFLSTTPFLHRAIKLYTDCGFVRTDEGPHELHGTPLFTMEKRPAVAPDRGRKVSGVG